MSRRWMTVHGGLLAAIAAAAWLHAEATPVPPGFELPELGRYYAVDLSGAHSAIDLEFDGDSRYELVVTSLGDGLQTYPVRLEAHARPRAELFPAVPVKSLRVPPKAPPCPVSGPTSAGASPSVFQQAARAESERRFFLHVTADRLEDEQ